ncbi:MAG: D-alanyl-D-alanine carboxypeptidase family protein [Candidatus Peregrinibacteria bacterium]
MAPEVTVSQPSSAGLLTDLNFTTMTSSQRIPVKNLKFIAPIVDAKATIIVDLDTGTVLYEKNADARLPIASITKLMTAFIITEDDRLNETVTISENAANTEGSNMFLRGGEIMALENLFYGVMINSANDAAVALAEHNSGTVDSFVKKMNEKAQELGLSNTHYSNPIGLDTPNNYSSARDLAKLGREVYKNQFIKHAVELKELEVKSVDGKYVHALKSTNELLENEFFHVKGLKTGSTDLAGLCFVSIAESDEGNEILTVVLNSPDRFRETKILIDWAFRAYNW